MDFSTSRAGAKSGDKRIKDAIEMGNSKHFGCCGAYVHLGTSGLTGITSGTYYAVYFPADVTIVDIHFYNWDDSDAVTGQTNDLDGVVFKGGTTIYGDLKILDLTASTDIAILYKCCN
tara:strand:- start:344 stop:697 length:354 start_codon:yes stop_codon:yes gene_type:complete